MNRKLLTEGSPDSLADGMYRDLIAHISAHWDEVERKTQDFTLMSVRSDVIGRVSFPPDCGLVFQGYEIVLRTPMPVLVSYGLWNLRIGPRLVAVRYREEIADWLSYLINGILPGALTAWRERSAVLERETIKTGRLQALERMYQESIRT